MGITVQSYHPMIQVISFVGRRKYEKMIKVSRLCG